MINYSCFCRLNIYLNLKLSKHEGQNLNTQIFDKCVCWKKVKVKALEKSGTASKSVFPCACLHAGVQSVVRGVPVEAPDPARLPSFCQNLQKGEGSFPVTSFTFLQQFRRLPSIPDSCLRLWQLWFSVEFSSGLTGFHSSSISHCWLGLSSFSGIITTWSLSYVLPPGEQEEKGNCL